MPYKDPEKRRSYQREYKRSQRSKIKQLEAATHTPETYIPFLDEIWFNVKEVAFLLCRSEETIRRWCREGIFTIYQPGPRKKIRIAASSLESARQLKWRGGIVQLCRKLFESCR